MKEVKDTCLWIDGPWMRGKRSVIRIFLIKEKVRNSLSLSQIFILSGIVRMIIKNNI